MPASPIHHPTQATFPGPPDKPAPIIAPEGLPIVIGFIVGALVLSALAAWLSPIAGVVVSVATGVLCLWCIWFFRDPPRKIPGSGTAGTPIISPADGVVSFVGPAPVPPELGLPGDQTAGLTRVSVFMNVFNVHVNRSPLAGVVEKTLYTPGKFFNASFDKASEHNERLSLVLDTDAGPRLICVQIAGLIARRIVCRVKPGDRLDAAERFGLIRFGSRVDVFLPAGVASSLKIGDRSVAGETVLGWLPAAADQKAGS